MAYPQPPDGTQPPSGPQPPDGTQPPLFAPPYAYQPPTSQPSPYGNPPSPYGPPYPYGQQPPYGQPYPYGQQQPYGQFQPYPIKPFWTTGKIVGAVLGVFLTVLLCGGVAVMSLVTTASPPTRHAPFDPGGFPGPEPLEEPLQTLGIGQCVSKIEGATSDPTVAIVPCQQAHRGEVFEIIPISGDAYPGEEALKGKLGNCSARLGAYAQLSKVERMKVFVVYPTSDRWEAGDHMVYCVVGSETVSTTGSVSKYK